MNDWQPIDTAPRGVWAPLTTDPAWVEPPTILVWCADTRSLALVRWDWYYAENGNGYEEGRHAWAERATGDRCDGTPTHWMPLADPPPACVAARQAVGEQSKPQTGEGQ